MPAAVGHPLTVYGTTGQTRAFIHIRDTVRCVALAVAHPPEKRAPVKIMNQVTEQHRVRDLAHFVADLTGAQIAMVGNPGKEAAENDLVVCNDSFLKLGLNPTTLREGLMAEAIEIAKKYLHRFDVDAVPFVSTGQVNKRPGSSLKRRCIVRSRRSRDQGSLCQPGPGRQSSPAYQGRGGLVGA